MVKKLSNFWRTATDIVGYGYHNTVTYKNSQYVINTKQKYKTQMIQLIFKSFTCTLCAQVTASDTQ